MFPGEGREAAALHRPAPIAGAHWQAQGSRSRVLWPLAVGPRCVHACEHGCPQLSALGTSGLGVTDRTVVTCGLWVGRGGTRASVVTETGKDGPILRGGQGREAWQLRPPRPVSSHPAWLALQSPTPEGEELSLEMYVKTDAFLDKQRA